MTLVHAAERQHDAAVRRPRRGAAHQAGVAALRHDGDAVVEAELYDLGDFLGVGRPHDDGRAADQRAAPVPHERLLALVVQDQALVAHDGAQAVEDGRRHRHGRNRRRMAVSGIVSSLCRQPSRRRPVPSSAAARRSRSLIARPNPVCGMGMTAMRPMSGRSSARSMANRLAAASARSPRGLRLSVDAGAGRHVGPERQQAFIGGDGRRARAAPAAPARSGCASWPGDLRAASPVGMASLSAMGPITASIASRVAPPGRSRVGVRGREIEHRRFESDVARPAIEDHRHPIAQRFGDMLGAGRADGAAAIGRGRGDRPADGADQRLRHGMRRRAHRHRVEAGRRQQRDRRVLRARQHEGERSRPEARGELVGRRRSSCTSRCASPASSTWLISGLNCGRPLASKIAATARSLVASPPRP